jgi:hypothetical protein
VCVCIVIHSFIEFFRVWFLEQTVWSNNKFAEWMLSCKYGVVHTPIAASFCYFGLWLPGTSSLNLSSGAPHISCVFVFCCCGAAQVKNQGLSQTCGENSCRSVLNGYNCLWKWSSILGISLDGLKDWETWGLRRWCPVGGRQLPRIQKQLRRLQTVGQRPSNDTKIDGGSTRH